MLRRNCAFSPSPGRGRLSPAALSRLPLGAPAHASQPLPPSRLSENSVLICLFIQHVLSTYYEPSTRR